MSVDQDRHRRAPGPGPADPADPGPLDAYRRFAPEPALLYHVLGEDGQVTAVPTNRGEGQCFG